jgi:hypothetical protein
MAELSFSQSEQRSFLVPGLIALAVMGGVFGLLAWLTPHRVAEIDVPHVAAKQFHTVIPSSSSGAMAVIGEDQAEDDLYVFATVRIKDDLKLPLFLSDFTGTLTGPDGTLTTASAIQKNDLAGLFVTFPALKPLAGPPLLRETAIQPGQTAEGMVLLHFLAPQATWDQRKSATVTIAFYHQDPITVDLPKPSPSTSN